MDKSASVVANDTPPSWSPSFTCFQALQLSQVYLHGAVEHCPGLGGLLALLLVEAPRRFLSFARAWVRTSTASQAALPFVLCGSCRARVSATLQVFTPE